MPRLIFTLFLLFACLANAVQAAPPIKTLTPAEARADIALVRAAMEEMHPGLTRYASRADIDSAWTRLEAAATKPMTELDLYRELSLALAVIRCDHTKGEYSQVIEAYRRESPTHLPFRFRLFAGETAEQGERMFIASSDPAQPLPFGAEILAINGEPVGKLTKTLGSVVAIDGFTEPVRRQKLMHDSDLTGNGFDHYWPAFFGFPAAWKVTLRERPDGPITTRELKPINFTQWQALPWPARYREEFHSGISWRLAGRTAVLKINTFVNYRNPVDAEALLSGYFRSANIRKVDHLVIDLRDSGGGSNDAVHAVLAHLIDRPAPWSRRTSVKALKAGDWVKHTERWDGRPGEYSLPEADYVNAADGLWDRKSGPDTPALNPVAPAPDAFKGRVTVLIGPANNSGATMLIAKLKDLGRVQLVGEATGGSAEGPTAGNLLMLRLPASGILVRVPLIFSRMDIRAFEPGMGVAPDVEVKQTLKDFLASKDSVMEWVRQSAQAPAQR
ncbi:MAG: S41 family peptidase [Burkholderiales bacterium]|nr:S41 family peptidase [Burkholderiales bacterium]